LYYYLDLFSALIKYTACSNPHTCNVIHTSMSPLPALLFKLGTIRNFCGAGKLMRTWLQVEKNQSPVFLTYRGLSRNTWLWLVSTVTTARSTKRCSYLVLQHVKQVTSLFQRSLGSLQGTKIVSDETLFSYLANSLSATKPASEQNRDSLLEDVFDVWIIACSTRRNPLFLGCPNYRSANYYLTNLIRYWLLPN